MGNNQGTIVVGVDGSKASRRALQWAAEHALAEHRQLTLVHTIGAVTPAFIDAAITDPGAAQAALDAAGRSTLGAARSEVERWAPGLDVTEVLEYADPGDLLVAMSGTAAMVVVGSHGRGPVRSKLLGSVSVCPARRSHCPVVIVRPGNAGTVRNGVVVGVDALPECQPVLEFAYREASLRGMPLTVLHAAWSSLAGTLEAAYLPVTPADRESELLALAEATAGMAEKYPDVTVTTRLTEGRPDEVLARMGDRMNLIVVGAHQRGRLQRALVRSVSIPVVERATCPVAIVPVGGRGLARKP